MGDKLSSKSQLGQFYTTNYDYILQNLSVPDNITHIVEPFVGNGDLLNFLDQEKYKLELYDIDPKIENAIHQDTLLNPPNYNNKFVLTNPPYLARNKNKNKTIYDKYNCNDLYKCFIKTLINSKCQGGIIIIPLNFICSIRAADIELRKLFFEKFHIDKMNIFEERVFDDTSYTVCSILFTNKLPNKLSTIYIYPSKQILEVKFTKENSFMIGGEIYNLPFNKQYKIERATKQNKTTDYLTNILVKCIDDNINSKLGFKVVEDKDRYIDNTPNLTARSYATLIINKKLTLDEQKELVKKLNTYLNEQRDKYHSLFLTNYRESNSIARKRISFDLAFKLCNYILSE